MDNDPVDRLLAGIAKAEGAEAITRTQAEADSLRAEGRSMIVEAIREIAGQTG